MANINLIKINRKLLERIFSKIQISTEHFYNGVPCWEWTGAKSNNGYGYIRCQNPQKSWRVHRLVYRLYVDPLPKELVCDHLCRVRHCINPCHIELVTNKENINRGLVGRAPYGPRKQRSRSDHKRNGWWSDQCQRGHLLTDDNVQVCRTGKNIGKRYCITCYKLRRIERLSS